jgi:hypothetical protein
VSPKKKRSAFSQQTELKSIYTKRAKTVQQRFQFIVVSGLCAMPPNGLDSAADLEAISQISAWKEGQTPMGTQIFPNRLFPFSVGTATSCK